MGGPAPSMGGGSNRKQCKALYDFDAENSDELTFSAGSVIDIIEEVRTT